jgi:hypothetical protein
VGSPTVTVGASSVAAATSTVFVATAQPSVTGGAELPDNIIVATILSRGPTRTLQSRGAARTILSRDPDRTVEFSG